MNDKFAAWRQRSWVWWLPAAFVSLCLGGIFYYQATYAGQLDKLEDRYGNRATRLESHRSEVERAEEFLQRVAEQDRQVGTLYRDHFATESERFTRVLREIRTLARRAGLDPRSFSYPGSEIDAYELNRLGIRFSVDGTYDQLRTFINFLELTDQFLTLESVKLAGGKGDRDARLQLRFGASTMFAQNDAESLELANEVLTEGTALDPTMELSVDIDDEEDPEGEESLDAESPGSVEESTRALPSQELSTEGLPEGDNGSTPEEDEET